MTNQSGSADTGARRVLPEHLRLALSWPRAERVMGPNDGGPLAERCIHAEFLSVFCPECAAFFCSLALDEVNTLVATVEGKP